MERPSIFFTISLLIILIVPFALRLLITEPYPAILFPSGHYKLDVSNDQVTITEFDCLVYSDSSKFLISINELLSDLPAQVRVPLINRKLGFFDLNDSSSIPKGLKRKLMPWKAQSLAKQAALKNWFRRSLGPNAQTIEIIEKNVTRDRWNGSILSIEILNKSSYSLYD